MRIDTVKVLTLVKVYRYQRCFFLGVELGKHDGSVFAHF